MSNNKAGFSAVLSIVAVVLVIGVLGFIGWRVYSQPSAKTNDAASNNQNTTKPPVSNNTPPATPQPTYLDIKEFGIKIPLDNSIADATYTYDPSSSSNSNPTESQLVSVTTKSLAAASNNKCNVQVITRTQDQNLMGTPLVPDDTNIFKIGSYYYILNGTQSVCSTDKNVQQLLFQQQNTFSKDFKTAQLYSATLDIKELGIKITLNDQIDDAVYAPFDSPYTDKSKTMGISAQSLITKDANCSASHGTIGVISELAIAPTYINSQRALPVDNKSLFKFGNNYYFYQRPQNQGCLTITQADTDLFSSKANAFAQAFATVQPNN